MSGPLEGLKVVDLTTVLMGPFATQMMADLGADVVKVEPLAGDPVRGIGPKRSKAMGPIFLQANRGKRSIAIDLKREAGRKIVLDLARSADVFVYNIRPRAMARLRLSYENISGVNPRIIYTGFLGYGQNGQKAALPAFDDLIQADVGLPYLVETVGADGPRFVPLAMADRFTGMWGLNVILSAICYRAQTGRGQSLEVPMYETMAQLVLADHIGGKIFDPPIGNAGYSRLLSKERRPFATLDGYVCVVIYNDGHWKRFFDVIGRPDLYETDPRFADMSSRTDSTDTIYALIAEVIGQWTTSECLSRLRKADIPVSPLSTIEDVLNDRHLVDSGFFTTVDHPTEGTLRMPGIPANFTASPPGNLRPAPNLGEQTSEVLNALGYSDLAIRKLLSERVILQM